MRRLDVLIDQLPPTSRTKRAILDWHVYLEQIAAVQVDAANIANWQRSYDPKRPTAPPKPFPQPGDALRKRIRDQQLNDRLARLSEWDEV